MIKQWLQHILGIDQIHLHLYDMRENRLDDRKLLNTMDTNIRVLTNTVRGVQATTSNIMTGTSRIIAKVDTEYGRSEFDPQKRAESDKLAEETIRRLEAEAAARAPYNEQ